jgi:choline/glycine/proline betaine transport protein
MYSSTDIYYRVEVFAQTGSEGYDLYGVSRQQIIDDVLDRHEARLGFRTYTHEHDYASVLTPATTATGSVAVVAEDAVEIRENLDSPETTDAPDNPRDGGGDI